jgi:hypothetical protein
MRKPFAPIGCAIQTHVKPDDRLSWDTRSEPGFNLGTSMEHHCCFRVYVTRTRATRISDTVFFKHQYITNPTLSPESNVVAAAQQLRNSRGTDEGEQVIHKNSSSKTSSSSDKRSAKQTQGKSDSTDYHSPSKGGRTTSKGGRTISKGGRNPQG